MSAVRLVVPVLLAILRINVLHATNCILPTKIVGSGNTAVCAGDRLTFTCNASSNLTTQERWRGSSWGGDGNQVTLSVSDPRGTSTIRAIAFNVSLVSNSPYLLTKVEIAAATQDLNGTTVTCLETTNGASYVDVGTGCIIFAAPPSDPEATPTYCTLDSVTLQWNGSLFDGGSNLTNYTLTSNPPSSNCNGSCALNPAARQYTFSGLQPGVPYTLGVRGNNCGGTQQGTQSTFNVTIPNPQAPLVCGIFDVATSNLTQVSTTWYPLRVGNSLLCGPVSSYNVTYAGPSGTEVYSIPAANCSSICSHFYAAGAGTWSQYNVSVAGFGVLPAINTIASTNNVLKVEVVNWTQSVTINCTFLSGLAGTSGCVVSFGTSPDNLPYTLTSSQRGGSGQSVSVPLVINGSPLDLHNSYFYTASLLPANSTNQCVIIRGSWCAPRALGTASVVTCACSDGSFGLLIPNGCACFTGIVPSSQASVECDNRSRRVGSDVLLCRPDGSWGGGVLPQCSPLETTPTSTATGKNVSVGTIVGAVVGSVVGFAIIVALVVVLTVVVVFLTLRFRSEKQAVKHGGVRVVEETKPGIPSHEYVLTGVPQTNPPPQRSIYSSDKNDHEWAAIMSVVQEAEKTSSSTH
eukprot:Em0005g518a